MCPHIYKPENCDGDHCSERVAFESDDAKYIRKKKYNIGKGRSGDEYMADGGDDVFLSPILWQWLMT
jgi:hypothetical protein